MPDIVVTQPAASAGFSRGDIIRVMAQRYGYPVDEPDEDFKGIVVDAMNETIDEIATRFRWRFALQFDRDNLQLTADQAEYDLATLFPGFDVAALLFEQLTPFLLRYVSFREVHEKFPAQDLTGEPYVYTLKDADTLMPWPTPGQDRTVSLAYYAQFPHLEDDNQRMFWRGKYDQVLLKGTDRWLARWRKDWNAFAVLKAEYEMAVRRMRADDCVVPDHKMRLRHTRENRSRYGVARDNSRDWGD